VPLGPTGAVTSDVQRFAWGAVPGAEQYHLEVTDGATAEAVVNVTVREISFTAHPFVVSGRWYRWSVSALRGTEQGPSCEDVIFSYERPRSPLPPAGPYGAVRGEYTEFSWSAVPTDTQYELNVVDAATGEPVLSGRVPPGLSVVAWKALSLDRPYRWTVTALSGTKRGPSSPPMDFSVTVASGLSSPESVGPIGSVEGGAPTFSWNAVSGADSYLLSVASGTKRASDGFGTSYVPTPVLSRAPTLGRPGREGQDVGPSSVYVLPLLAPNHAPSVAI
jgi:hypothetical protein